MLLLMSDHGTHGIWYATDFEIGAAEHKLPVMYVLAPDWLMREKPHWAEALRVNQKRLVTVREVYESLRELAAWPEAPDGPARPSLFTTLPASRTCADAGVPEQYCACSR